MTDAKDAEDHGQIIARDRILAVIEQIKATYRRTWDAQEEDAVSRVLDAIHALPWPKPKHT